MTDLFDRPAPHLVIDDAFPADEANALLHWAMGREVAFRPSRIMRSSGIDGRHVSPNVRSSRVLPLRGLAPWRPALTERFTALLPMICRDLGTKPFERPELDLELELAAHGDGDFYSCHRDNGVNDKTRSRVLSVVYYFNTEPAGFSGGALRLHAMRHDVANAVEILPRHNRLVAFPSWAPHEVMPISCPSGDFAASRFAINCWVHRVDRAAASDQPQS